MIYYSVLFLYHRVRSRVSIDNAKLNVVAATVRISQSQKNPTPAFREMTLGPEVSVSWGDGSAVHLPTFSRHSLDEMKSSQETIYTWTYSLIQAVN